MQRDMPILDVGAELSEAILSRTSGMPQAAGASHTLVLWSEIPERSRDAQDSSPVASNLEHHVWASVSSRAD